MEELNMKEFKPCAGCPTPAKCKKMGKCMKKEAMKSSSMKTKQVKRGY